MHGVRTVRAVQRQMWAGAGLLAFPMSVRSSPEVIRNHWQRDELLVEGRFGHHVENSRSAVGHL